MIAFLAIVAFLVVTEHTAHALGALPYLLLLACPLLHFFHGGYHKGHRDHDETGSKRHEEDER